MGRIALVAASCLVASALVFPASAGENVRGLTFRQRLAAISPIVINAVTLMEAERGATFTDSELRDAIKSPQFREEHRVAFRQFCAKPENADNMACMPDARRTDPAGT